MPHRPLVPHPEKSIGEARMDGNLIIQGDNLLALKSLLPMYAGKVDCVFTTAHAVLAANKKDGGDRKFILVECEDYADMGGSFTYCTLGAAIEMDKMLTGETLPTFEQLGALLYHMATNESFDAAQSWEKDGHGYLGESTNFHVWLIYRPDLDFLKSRDAALTLSKAKALVEVKPGKRHLVFAPAKFVSQKLLAEAGLQVEFAPLPFALYRIERQ